MKSNTFYSVLGGALLALITTVAPRAAVPFPAHQDLFYGRARFIQCLRFLQENLRTLGMIPGHTWASRYPLARITGKPGARCRRAVNVSQPFMRGMVTAHRTPWISDRCFPEELHRLDAVRRRQRGIARVVSNSIDEAAALEWFGELALRSGPRLPLLHGRDAWFPPPHRGQFKTATSSKAGGRAGR